jgi:hypothetical protein
MVQNCQRSAFKPIGTLRSACANIRRETVLRTFRM